MKLSKLTSMYLFIITSLIFYFIQLNSQNLTTNFANFFIGDGITFFRAIKEYKNGNVELNDFASSKLFVFINYLFYKLIDYHAFYLLNLFLLYLIGKRFNINEFYFYPFFLLSIALPSKDIFVAYLTLEIFYLLVINQNKNLLKIIFFLILLYFVRDAALPITLIVILSFYLNKKLNIFITLMISFFISAFIFIFIGDLVGDFEIISRNYQTYLSSSFLNCCSFNDYIYRIIGNATNLSFRQNIFDIDNRFSIINIIYFLNGIVMIDAMYLAIKFLFYNKNVSNILTKSILFYFVALFTCSINPFVQPRYMLPYIIPLVFYCNNRLSSERIYKYCFFVVISIFISLTYNAFDDNYPKKVSSELFDINN